MTQTSAPQPFAEFARRLLRREARAAGAPADLAAGLQSACRALNDRLSPLISSAGFQMLFARAIRLAARDSPCLASMSVGVDGECVLSGMPDANSGWAPDEIVGALVAVLATFIWLLVLFIGENLALRKVREVWPNVPFETTDASGVEE